MNGGPEAHDCQDFVDGGPKVPSSSERVTSGIQESEELAGTRELKLDQPTGEMLLAVGYRDDRPLVDAACPVDYATCRSPPRR